jgi:hypothetical protein
MLSLVDVIPRISVELGIVISFPQAQVVAITMSTFKLQNRIKDTGRVITGMVVTDDGRLLLCDNSFGSKLVAVYYPSGTYMGIYLFFGIKGRLVCLIHFQR